MTDITTPVLSFRVRLPRRNYVLVVVWPDVPSLRINTPDEPKKDYAALWAPSVEGACVGTLHLAATDLSVGTRAHEAQHALDEITARWWREDRAELAETLAREIDKTLKGKGLI